MKNFKLILLSVAGLLSMGLMSCNSDMDSDPRYSAPTEFVLNTPKYSSALYDLQNTETVQLTCSQPNYGYAAPTEYVVQVSTNNKWTEAEGYDAKTQNLPITYTTAKMDIDAKELDLAICQALKLEKPEDCPSDPIKVYIRLQAFIPSVEGSEIYSNSIELPNVQVYYALPDVVLPTQMYMIGKFCEWNWNSAAKMIAINGHPEKFWTIRYVKAGEGFKFNYSNSWDGNDFGYNESIVTLKNTDAAGKVSADKDGNFTIEKSGWYIFAVTTTIVGREYNYTVEILPPNVYVYGAANGGIWSNDAAWKFAVVDDPDAEFPFVSPTVLATSGTDDSCLRLCIHPDEWTDIDWWRTEFIFFNGVITYRAAGNDQDRVGNAAGKVYLNFVTGSAKVE